MWYIWLCSVEWSVVSQLVCHSWFANCFGCAYLHVSSEWCNPASMSRHLLVQICALPQSKDGQTLGGHARCKGTSGRGQMTHALGYIEP